MKKSTLICLLLTLFITSPSQARNEVKDFPIADALQTGKERGVVDPDIKLYFAGQGAPKATRNFGEYKTNKKTNAFNKNDKTACEWAFLSAIKSLQSRALKLGAHAVVNIKSNYKSKTTSSATTYQCGAGNVLAGVALKGDVIKTK